MTLNPTSQKSTQTTWHGLADRVLAGSPVNRNEALEILQCADDQLLDLLAASFRIRHKWFGKTVQLYFLMNAKSGLCPEDCSYCSQSKTSTAEIPKYNLLDRKTLLQGAQAAAERAAIRRRVCHQWRCVGGTAANRRPVTSPLK